MDHLSDKFGERNPDGSAKTRTESCDIHGEFISRHILGNRWSRCSECQKIQEDEQARIRQEEEAKKKRAHLDAWLGRSAIPVRFIGRSFDNFKASTPDQARALSVMRGYSEGFASEAKAGKGLILTGKPGTGKSHLAAAVLQSLTGRHVMYATCMDIIRMVRETWRKGSERSERQVLAHLGDLDLLAIDEMGVQYGTDGEQTILFDVLDLRYRNVKPTILLTNQDLQGLKTFIGDRSYDRLKETCRHVSFEWESYRPQARKEAGESS